jgi:hypothetical protein
MNDVTEGDLGPPTIKRPGLRHEGWLLYLRVTMFDADSARSEFLAGLIAFGYGLWFAIPWFDAYGSSPTWRILSQILSEWQFGLSLGLPGLVQVIAVVTHRHRLREWLALYLMTYWLFLWVLGDISNPTSVTSLLYLIFAFGQFSLYATLRRHPDR